jgi:hypothetical protein
MLKTQRMFQQSPVVIQLTKSVFSFINFFSLSYTIMPGAGGNEVGWENKN